MLAKLIDAYEDDVQSPAVQPVDPKPLLDLTDKDIGRMGRSDLVSRLQEAIGLLRRAQADISETTMEVGRALVRESVLQQEITRHIDEKIAIRSEHREMLANLTAAQARGTELLTALRASVVVEKLVDNGPTHEPLIWQLVELGAAIGRAKELHPEGADLAALTSEFNEVVNAIYCEKPHRALDELLDLAVVAMRMRHSDVTTREYRVRSLHLNEVKI